MVSLNARGRVVPQSTGGIQMRLNKNATIIILLALTATAATGSLFPQLPFQPQRHVVFNGRSFEYFGPDDPVLSGSDWLQMSLTVQYYSELHFFPSRHDLLGIVNTSLEPLQGWIRLHLDNWDRPNVDKLIWAEIDWIADAKVDFELQTPEGYSTSLLDSFSQQLPDGFFQDNALLTVTPNPPWEDFYCTFTVQPGKMLLIDRLEIATICVPETSSLLALAYAVGCVGFLFLRRRQT